MFDRQEIRSLFMSRVDGFLAGYRQNIALLGPEGIGKTTLLKRLIQEKTGKNLIPVFLEFQEKESVAEWVSRFLKALFYGVLRAYGVGELPKSWSELVLTSRPRIPKSCSQARQLSVLMESRKDQPLFEQVWDLPGCVSEETGLPILLVLDEFHLLSHFPVKDPLRKLGQKIMVQASCLFIVSSSQPSLARTILREGLHLLFGQFETVEVGPLTTQACRKALRTVGSGQLKDPFIEHLLIELIQGYPVYLERVIQKLADQTLWKTVEDPHVRWLDLLELLLYDSQGGSTLGFEDRIRSLPSCPDRRDWMEVLFAVAKGFHRVPGMAHQVDREPSQVLRALKVLEQTKLVVKHGPFYRIPDRWFQLWILMVYPIATGVAQVDDLQARSHFREALRQWVVRVRQAIQQAMEDRVVQLLKQWESERIELGGRRILLPQWEKIERLSGSGICPMLVARRVDGKGLWLILPWTGALEENQVRELLRQIGRLAAGFHQRILVGAYPVEGNARLILKTAGIRLWDLPVLNFLLDLYGQVGLPLPTETPGLWIQTLPMARSEVDESVPLSDLKRAG